MTSPAKDDSTAPLSSAAHAGGHVCVRLEHRPLWSIARALIGRQPGVVFLDSGGGSSQARWSFLGWNPRRVIAWPQGRAGAFECLRTCFDETRVPRSAADTMPFCAGWMGWFSYDLGRHIEQLPSIARADPSLPDFVIGEYDMVLAEDHASGALWAAGRCVDAGDERRLRARAEEALRIADGSAASEEDAPHADLSGRYEPPRPLMDRATYRQRVEAILDHIREGDIYQANFSHRFSARIEEPSRSVYARLRSASPAPFGCYVDLPGGPEILSVSPELFVRKTSARLQTRPIKGTRPRADDVTVDTRLRDELEASEKERAELLMITDLLRNDLGRVATYGSVKVARLRELESHSTVHHAHSVIEALLREELGVADVLAAMIPGGSVTGAPKIRAMEILEELEPVRRGPYTGAAGFIGDDGDMCLNILIRSLIRQGDDVWYQVGGGIVADSDPEAEYQETLAKGLAMRRAL